MSWYWYVIIFLILAISLIILSEVKVHILLKKQEKNDFIVVNLWFLYNLIHIRKEIPLVLAKSFEEGIMYESNTSVNKTKKTDEKKERITPRKAVKWRKQTKKFLSEIHNFYAIIKVFLKHVKIDLFKWESKIGTGDAMVTGILNGLLWGVKGSIIGLISKYFRMTEKPIFSVVPEYNKVLYHSMFECILRFKVGHVIVTGIRILFKLTKGGGKKWRENIQFKA